MIGYIGLGLLGLAYVFLLINETLFIPVNIVASILLTIHAIKIKDKTFIIVNGFIALMLIIKFIN